MQTFFGYNSDPTDLNKQNPTGNQNNCFCIQVLL